MTPDSSCSTRSQSFFSSPQSERMTREPKKKISVTGQGTSREYLHVAKSPKKANILIDHSRRGVAMSTGSHARLSDLKNRLMDSSDTRPLLMCCSPSGRGEDEWRRPLALRPIPQTPCTLDKTPCCELPHSITEDPSCHNRRVSPNYFPSCFHAHRNSVSAD